uniref:Uncharacterized protein n=1 Tax=Lactuca sativa TaxID=4236 RepID=A0A9R1XGP7_LACSA|nr:hypothetical protein LSAT_V11C500267300 [Lactuca sativa]
MQGLRRSENVEHGKINLIMWNMKTSPVTKIGVPIEQIDMGFHLKTDAYYIWITETFPNNSIVGSPILGSSHICFDQSGILEKQRIC